MRVKNRPVVWTTIFIVFAVTSITLVFMGIRVDEPADRGDVEMTALDWVGEGRAQPPRRDGDTWEVEVVRRNGSMVQVTLDNDLRLRGLDEESGPAGTLAHDELTGPARARAVQAAFAEVGPGQVIEVERDSSNQIEVRIQQRGGRQIEVEMDRRFRVREVEADAPRDE
jgi:hypothetical protein